MELYIPWRLKTGDTSSVAALLPELPASDAERWGRLVDQVREQQAREHSDFEANNLAHAARERRNVGAVALVGATVLSVAFAVYKPAASISGGDLVALSGAAFVMLLLAILPFRHALLAHKMSRSIMFGMLVTTIGSLLHRIGAWNAGAPIAATLQADALLIATASAIIASTTDRGVYAVVPPLLAAAVWISIRPADAYYIFPIALLVSVCFLAVAFGWRAHGPGAGGERS